MNGRDVRIHPLALEEAEVAAAWYRRRSSKAANAFLTELDRTIGRIAQFPENFPGYEFGTRRALLRRFPYLIIFREHSRGIEIVAVMHGRRKPGYWRERI